MNKKQLLPLIILLITFSFSCTQQGEKEVDTKTDIAVTETYKASSAVRSGIALGGIGTGSVELRKDGNFYNWSIFNNYPHGAGPIFSPPVLPNKNVESSFLFFLVRYQVEGEKPKLKLLQVNNSIEEAGMEGISYYYPWMENIEQIEYTGTFPFVNIVYSDSEMPFDIKLEAFSPFIPHDVKNSSLPGVYFNFEIESKTDNAVDVMLVASLRNLVAYDDTEKAFASEIIEKDNYKFFVHSVDGFDKTKSSYGQMGLGAIGGEEITYYLGWEHKHPYYEKLLVNNKFENIDDTEGRNLKNTEGKTIGRLGMFDNDQRSFSSIATSHKLNKNSKVKQTFFMNWYFGNNYGAIQYDNKSTSPSVKWDNKYGINLKNTKNIGHYYQNNFDAIECVSQYFVDNSKELEKDSREFTDNFYKSNIDGFILNQVNSHLNTFITSSTLTKDGTFVVREGLTSSQQWGPTATADVGLYGSQMAIALFPELQMSMMRAHKNLQGSKGEINHGLAIDPDYNQNGTWGVYDRIDLIPNYIQMVMRDYFWTNDKEYLAEMWPSIKLGLDYMLKYRDKDGDKMPDMEGIMCSYDNFPMYGLASYIQSQWISTLAMASEGAKDMGDLELQKEYSEIAERGKQLMDDKLWNGKYYRLSNDYNGDKGIDEGCLTDQLIGEWVSQTSGMGPLFDSKRVKTALGSILEMSFMDNHFLRNCSWPEYPELYPIERSELWVDQANTPWTGVELAFASLLIYEGMVDEGTQVIKAVDARHRKNGLYWDHQEFGGHYYRPMSAWSIVNAFLGLSINRGVYTFEPKNREEEFKMFFSGPEGTAFYTEDGNTISIEALTGKQVLNKIIIKSKIAKTDNIEMVLNKKNIDVKDAHLSEGKLIISFNSAVVIDEGQSLDVIFKN